MADPAAWQAEMLAELTEISLRMVRQAEVTVGLPTPEQAAVYDVLTRSLRRSVALRARLDADSRKTPEQLAAEWARREAISARWRDRKAPAQPGGAARSEAEAGPSDNENLLSDMNEKLLGPHGHGALTRPEVSDIMLSICHDIGLTPRKEIWSDALMASEAGKAHAAMKQAAAERAAWQAKVAAGADWRAGVEFSPPPGEIRKIGRFTCGPSGAVIAEEPMEIDPPQSAWAPDVLGRALPDFTLKKKPPDTG